MITQKTKVKKKFNDGGIQMTIDALNSIDDYVLRIIAQTVKNAVGNDIKRLTGEADQMAQVLPLDNIQPSKTAEEEKSCQRCGSVPSFIMDAAYAMRGHCEDKEPEKQVIFRLTESQFESLRQYCFDNRVSRNSLLREFVESKIK